MSPSKQTDTGELESLNNLSSDNKLLRFVCLRREYLITRASDENVKRSSYLPAAWRGRYSRHRVRRGRLEHSLRSWGWWESNCSPKKQQTTCRQSPTFQRSAKKSSMRLGCNYSASGRIHKLMLSVVVFLLHPSLKTPTAWSLFSRLKQEVFRSGGHWDKFCLAQFIADDERASTTAIAARNTTSALSTPLSLKWKELIVYQGNNLFICFLFSSTVGTLSSSKTCPERNEMTFYFKICLKSCWRYHGEVGLCVCFICK